MTNPIAKLMTTLISVISLSFLTVGCSETDFSSRSQSSLKASGESYAGKVYSYRIDEFCSDGTNVASSIEVTPEGQILLVKDNCQILSPPQALQSSEVDRSGAESILIYQNHVYIAEKATDAADETPGPGDETPEENSHSNGSVCLVKGTDYAMDEAFALYHPGEAPTSSRDSCKAQGALGRKANGQPMRTSIYYIKLSSLPPRLREYNPNFINADEVVEFIMLNFDPITTVGPSH
ncbi:MAG: hypothetical protein AB7G93_15470 [Bdellovibrionales bacterium]